MSSTVRPHAGSGDNSLDPVPRCLPLQQGDAVAVVAASSALESPKDLGAGLNVLASWGLDVSAATAMKARRWGYLAGTDAERRADLVPSSKSRLLACARGGWGAARLLEQPIQWPSGWLLGFSDVTTLLWARLAAGVTGGVHGPLVTTLASEPHWSQERLRQLLFGQQVAPLTGRTWRAGLGRGPLIVANLTVASHLLGSPFVPDLDGAILVLEDVGEAPYRLDRMLTQWRLLGLLQNLAGLAFGRFHRCDPDHDDSPGFQLEEVLRERSEDLGIPVLGDLPVGHGSGGNAALPLGRLAELDGDRGLLSLL